MEPCSTDKRGVTWQAFAFPVSGELWKTSYRLLTTTTLDGMSELSGVIDTEKYYQSITTDGTSSGAPPYLPCEQGLISPWLVENE